MESFKLKIKNKNLRVGIIGLGYVGLPLAIRFVQEGFRVVGFDTDENKIEQLSRGESYLQHIDNQEILSISSEKFTATSKFKLISKIDAILICVPTPLGAHNEPDLSFITGTLKNIKPYLKENQLLVLGSTTYPGTTEEIIATSISSIQIKNNINNNYTKKKSKNYVQKLKVGKNFYLGYSPEREDPGNKNFSTKTIPRVVSGVTENCLSLTKLLYDQIVDQTVPVSSTKIAEMTKILENIYRSVNIGLVNELKMVAEKLNIDIFEAINAAATKPFGFTPYYPGPGLGGHCIPIDPFYLTWKAKEKGIRTRFIELAAEINAKMPFYVERKISEALNAQGKSLKGSKILILGLSYKKNIDDCRESPSLEIINLLLDRGVNVSYSDPYFPNFPSIRKYNFNIKNIKLSPETIKSFDILVLATDHDSFDYDLLHKDSKIIIDTRNRFKNDKKIIRA